jgi:hypothetical protein
MNTQRPDLAKDRGAAGDQAKVEIDSSASAQLGPFRTDKEFPAAINELVIVWPEEGDPIVGPVIGEISEAITARIPDVLVNTPGAIETVHQGFCERSELILGLRMLAGGVAQRRAGRQAGGADSVSSVRCAVDECGIARLAERFDADENTFTGRFFSGVGAAR